MLTLVATLPRKKRLSEEGCGQLQLQHRGLAAAVLTPTAEGGLGASGLCTVTRGTQNKTTVTDAGR